MIKNIWTSYQMGFVVDNFEEPIHWTEKLNVGPLEHL